MILAGLDPGLSGGVAAFDTEAGRFVNMCPIQTRADGSNRQIDYKWLCEWLEAQAPDVAVIENVQPMPSMPGANGVRRSMGATSAFRYGLACGQLRGIIQAYGVECVYIHPRTWKGAFGLKGGDKQTGVEKLKQTHPETAQFITLKKLHGLADAGYLALYYAEQQGFV